jgi:hypothetical protein
MDDDPTGTKQRQALNEPESPRGDPPLAIVYDGRQARVTEPNGLVVRWEASVDVVADYAHRLGMTSVPTTTSIAAWNRP